MDSQVIFEMQVGGDEYRAMLVEEEKWDDWRRLDAVGPLVDVWTPPTLRYYKPGETGLPGDRKNRPLPTGTDMPLVFGCLMIVVSERFMTTVGSALARHGEFLPCHSKEGTFFVFHCMNELDVLDEDRSEVQRSRDGKRIVNVLRYHFRSEAIAPHSVFRINKGNRYTVFVTSDVNDAIHHPSLRGITTRSVWPRPHQGH